MLRALPLTLVLVVLTHASHRGLDGRKLPQPSVQRDTLPSPAALRLLSLGHRSLVADYYWLRAVSHFGDKTQHEYAYPDLEPLLSRALDLDPYFGGAYQFAGTALTVQGIDPKLSSRLLERGLTFRPDLWQIPFYLGFNLYYFEGEYERAAEMLARAAPLPGAPEVAGLMATRIAAEAGRPEIGMRLVETMLEQLEDPALRAEYEARRTLLQVEAEVRYIEHAVTLYRAQHGAAPGAVRDLVRPGLLSREPVDPFGAPYVLDAQGLVVVPAGVVRLRVLGAGRPSRSEPKRPSPQEHP